MTQQGCKRFVGLICCQALDPCPPRRRMPGITEPTLWTYLALSFLAVGSRLGIVAVLSACTLDGQFILSQLLLRRLGLGWLWRRLAGSASPLGAGDGLRALRNSLNIHLHLPIHWRARQKRSADLAAAPGSYSAARGTHGSPRRGRLPRALPSATLRPRSPQLRSPARLRPWRRLGRGARGAGGRVSLERWPSGASGSPAKQSASRRRRLPAALPASGPLGDLLCSPAHAPSRFPASLGAPRRFSSLPTF
ncbi:uncharacterized protein LOC115834667 [Nomascus leucogenys]|uniref:uncharacterized protein LOC115834667 n=1 Tax=Nomascus leucogenys TaxID=61853 RepID=UPI00122D9B74|nr:uncharacterized protein LOC115834667 [Nomascus leucogenys]